MPALPAPAPRRPRNLYIATFCTSAENGDPAHRYYVGMPSGWGAWADDQLARFYAIMASGRVPDGWLVDLAGGLRNVPGQGIQQIFGVVDDADPLFGTPAMVLALTRVRNAASVLRMGLTLYTGLFCSDDQQHFTADPHRLATDIQPLRDLGVRLIVDSMTASGPEASNRVDNASGQRVGIEGMASVGGPAEHRSRRSVQIAGRGPLSPWDPETYTGGPDGAISPSFAPLGTVTGEIIALDTAAMSAAEALFRARLTWALDMSAMFEIGLYQVSPILSREAMTTGGVDALAVDGHAVAIPISNNAATTDCPPCCGPQECMWFYEGIPCIPEGGPCPGVEGTIWVCREGICNNGERPELGQKVRYNSFCYRLRNGPNEEVRRQYLPAGAVIVEGGLDCRTDCNDGCASPRFFRELRACNGTPTTQRVFMCASLIHGCGLASADAPPPFPPNICWEVSPTAPLVNENDLPPGATVITSGSYAEGAKCCECVPGCETGRMVDQPPCIVATQREGGGFGQPARCCCNDDDVTAVVRHSETFTGVRFPQTLTVQLIGGGPGFYRVHIRDVFNGEVIEDFDRDVPFDPMCAWIGFYPEWQLTVTPQGATQCTPGDYRDPDGNGAVILSYRVEMSCDRFYVTTAWESWINLTGTPQLNFRVIQTFEARRTQNAGGPCSGGCSGGSGGGGGGAVGIPVGVPIPGGMDAVFQQQVRRYGCQGCGDFLPGG